MSMTKATRPTTRPRKLVSAIMMVAPREANETPARPKKKAKRERPPAMGCRTSVLDRLWSSDVSMFVLRSVGTLPTNVSTPAAWRLYPIARFVHVLAMHLPKTPYTVSERLPADTRRKETRCQAGGETDACG